MTALEENILKTKGMTDAPLKALVKAGVTTRSDFATVGDAATLLGLIKGLKPHVADAIMAWAIGAAPSGASSVVVESSDVVYCVHCRAKQPKDYKSGDLYVARGKQAEPILTCFWCSSSGPGKFCRACGAESIGTAELELAVHLKREGIAKNDIPVRLKAMSAAEKDVL